MIISKYDNYELINGNLYLSHEDFYVSRNVRTFLDSLKHEVESKYVIKSDEEAIILNCHYVQLCRPTSFIFSTNKSFFCDYGGKVYEVIPQFIVEVKCSNNAHVIRKKFQIYKECKVPEIWIIDIRDVNNATVDIFLHKRDYCGKRYSLRGDREIFSLTIRDLYIDTVAILDKYSRFCSTYIEDYDGWEIWSNDKIL